jgi:hypothetical protein
LRARPPIYLVFTSPLPVLGPALPSATELLHRVDLRAGPPGDARVAARLRLSPDRKRLTLTVDAQGDISPAIDGEGSRAPQAYLAFPPASDLAVAAPEAGIAVPSCGIILELAPGPKGAEVHLGFECLFDLDDPQVEPNPGGAAFCAAVLNYSGIEACVIDGITVIAGGRRGSRPGLVRPNRTLVQPPLSAPPLDFRGMSDAELRGLRDCDYLRRRMHDEAEAAAIAPSAVAASIHVRLATLYARSLIAASSPG